MKLHLTGLLILSLLSALPAADADALQRQTQLRGPKDATNQYSGAVYGPIDEQDTLWRIAERYRQNKSVSVYQVMQAIFELNPNAFEQQNLNLLVEGATLRLPSERYIARINKTQAQQRADRDDDEFAKLLNQPQQSNNIKPPVPLVDKAELSSTRDEIEKKINQLDEQQLRQFDELRNQFSASLDSVSALLDENRKLFDRVEQVNTDLMNLRQQVEGDVQSQMDEQLALQRQLLDMVRQEQAEREAEKNSSFMQTLTQPVSLIIGSGILTLLLAGGLAAWLLRRKQAEPQPEAAQASPSKVTETIADDVDDLSTSLTSGLDEDTAELSDDALFNDDELLDDVLAGELDESMGSDSEVFSDIDDDMLVPDGDQIFEDGTAEIGQDELDSLFDDDELSDTALGSSDLDDDVLDGIDLADDNPGAEEEQVFTDESEAQAELANTEATEDDFHVSTDDEAIDEPGSSDIPASFNAVEADEKPEISIDDLLDAEQNQQDSLTGAQNVDDDMLDKLDKEINEQNEELDRLADNILDEIDQLEQMGGLPDIDDEEPDPDEIPSSSVPSPQSIQNLDTLAGELDETDIDEAELDASDSLADELLAELEAEGLIDEPEEEIVTEDPLASFDDPLGDELLAELEAEGVVESDSDQEAITLPGPDAEAEGADDSTAGFDDPLGDELLAELNAEQDDELEQLDALSDELLAELGGDENTDIHSESGVQVDTTSDQLDDELTSELLAELEQGITADEPDQQSLQNQDIAEDDLDIDALIAAQQADAASDDPDTAASPEPEKNPESDDELLDETGLEDLNSAENEKPANSADQGDMPEALNLDEDVNSDDAFTDTFNIDENDSPLEHNEVAAPELDDVLSESDEPTAEMAAPDESDSDGQSLDDIASEEQNEDDFAALADELLADTRQDEDPDGQSLEDIAPEEEASPHPENTPESLNLDEDVNSDDAFTDTFNIDENDSQLEHNEVAAPELGDVLSELDEPTAEMAVPDESGSDGQSLDDIASKEQDSDGQSSIDADADSHQQEPDEPSLEDPDGQSLDDIASKEQNEDDFAALADELLADSRQEDLHIVSEAESEESSEPETSPHPENAPEALNLDENVNSDDAFTNTFDIDENDSPLEHNEVAAPELDDVLSESDEPIAEMAASDESGSDGQSLDDIASEEQNEGDFAALAEELLDAEKAGGDEQPLSGEDSYSAGQTPEEDLLSVDQLEDEFAELADEMISPSGDAETTSNAFDTFSEEELEAEFAGEPSLEIDDNDSLPEIPETSLTDSPTSESMLSSESADAHLEDALAEFDQKMMDDIPSFSQMDDKQTSDFDDSILDFSEQDVDALQLDQEQDGVIPAMGDNTTGSKDIDELDDVPGLDDWLSDNKSDDRTILDELESSDFDALLNGMDAEEKAEATNGKDSDTDDFKLQNPDIDLAALLSDPDAEKGEQDEYLDVETLLDESMQDGGTFEEMPLDLDVSLSDFSGVNDDMDMIDIDKDAGQSANLDLARVYLEMDDMSSAKELLEEVLQQGSEEQKKEANQLLESIA